MFGLLRNICFHHGRSGNTYNSDTELHPENHKISIWSTVCLWDRLCGLVVRVPGYRSRDPEFDSRRYQIFWEVVGMERGPLSLVRITEELLD
jgi:hypothetical protein